MSRYRVISRPERSAGEAEQQAYRYALRDALNELGVPYGGEFVLIARQDLNGLGEAMKPFSRGSDTSEQAAYDNLPRADTQKRKVFEAIGGSGGLLTRDQLAGQLGLPDSSVDARIWELKKGDWVCEGERKRRTRQGSEAHVVELTPKGEAAFEEARNGA